MAAPSSAKPCLEQGMARCIADPAVSSGLTHSHPTVGYTSLAVRAVSRRLVKPRSLHARGGAMGALSVSQFVDLMVGGLAVGCVYSLIALGFAMIMRATNIIHFAQGEVLMLGCMCGLTSVWLLPVLPLLLVVAVGMASSGIIAVAMELAVYRTLRRRRVPIMNLITATVGMSIL